MNYKASSIPQLIEKCQGRDALAWAEFVRRFSPLINYSIRKAFTKYHLGRSAGGEEINDVRQDIMLSLWGKNKLSEVKNSDAIDYWLVTISKNATFNYLRARKKEVLVSDEEFFEKQPAASFEAGDEAEAAHKTLERFYGRISPKEKIVFALYFERKLALKDIARIIRAPLGSVSSIVTRMRKKLTN